MSAVAAEVTITATSEQDLDRLRALVARAGRIVGAGPITGADGGRVSQTVQAAVGP